MAVRMKSVNGRRMVVTGDDWGQKLPASEPDFSETLDGLSDKWRTSESARDENDRLTGELRELQRLAAPVEARAREIQTELGKVPGGLVKLARNLLAGRLKLEAHSPDELASARNLDMRGRSALRRQYHAASEELSKIKNAIAQKQGELRDSKIRFVMSHL